MFIVSVAGIVFNLIVGSVLGHGHSHGGGHDHGHDHGHCHSTKTKKAGDSAKAKSEHVHGSGCKHDHSSTAKTKGGHVHGGGLKQDHGADHQHKDHEEHGHDVEAAAGHSHEGHDHSHEGHNHEHEGHSHEHEDGHKHDKGHDHDEHDEEENINLRSAMLHVLGDLVQSAGVALAGEQTFSAAFPWHTLPPLCQAGALIWYNEGDARWYIADPICTFVFAIIVLLTTVTIVRDIVNTLMERAPSSVDMQELLLDMRSVEGVMDVHDLHVWNLSSGTEPIMTAHVHVHDNTSADAVLKRLEAHVKKLGITHSTIQICNIEGAALAVSSP